MNEKDISHSKVPRNSVRLCAVVLGAYSLVTPSPIGYDEIAANDEAACMASAIYHEARGEHVRAQRAVAEVVLNRAWKSGKSVCEIVAQKRQFAWYAKHKIMAMDAALAAMLDKTFKQERILKNGTFLFFYSGRQPYWAATMTCRPIGRLTFCKEKSKSSPFKGSTASTRLY